jgi:hypothetical protein
MKGNPRGSPGGTCPRITIINNLSNLCTIEEDSERGQREKDHKPQGGWKEDNQGVAQEGTGLGKHQEGEGHDHHHPHQQDLKEDGAQGDKAVTTACRNGMPGSISQASC